MLDAKTIQAQLEHITSALQDLDDATYAHTIRQFCCGLNRLARQANKRELYIAYEVDYNKHLFDEERTAPEITAMIVSEVA